VAASSPPSLDSAMFWMSMPNWVPQSPTWFSRSVSTPQYSRVRAMVSPMMVDRRCPTCISLATLGEEKSTTARLYGSAGAHVAGPSTSRARSRAARAARETRTLMKPGPAMEGGASRRGVAGSAATIAAATSRGDLGAPSAPFSPLKTPMALLHW
jgi:hypothetical protein